MGQDRWHVSCVGALVVGAMAAGLLSCARAPEPRSLAGLQGIDVVILVLDACRADRIGAYGYELPTTPTLDELAASPDSVMFLRHYAHGASTKPSTATLFTGLFTHQHGVRIGVLKSELREDEPLPKDGHTRMLGRTLGEDVATLSEIFADAGFTTIGLVKSAHLAPEWGFARGFHEYVSRRDVSGDEERVEKSLDLIDDVEGHHFTYMHLNACHHPFPENERDRDFMDAYGFDYPEEERKRAGLDFTTPAIKFESRRRKIAVQPDDRRFLSLIYDSEVRRTDRELVAPFLEGLRALGRYDDTLLIVTADHGEELFEHDSYAHGHAVWEEISHVPLIVKFPAGLKPDALGPVVDALTTNLDLMPSFLDLLGKPVPAALPGRPILRAAGADRMLLLTSTRQWGVVSSDYKLVANNEGDEKLFDLRADPQESRDLSSEHAERADELRAFKDRMLALPGGSAPLVERDIDPEQLESLRALGYIE
jgi:arylsulfatase A-like enzyme